VHLVSSKLLVGHWMVLCSLPRVSSRCLTRDAWLEEAAWEMELDNLLDIMQSVSHDWGRHVTEESGDCAETAQN